MLLQDIWPKEYCHFDVKYMSSINARAFILCYHKIQHLFYPAKHCPSIPVCRLHRCTMFVLPCHSRKRKTLFESNVPSSYRFLALHYRLLSVAPDRRQYFNQFTNHAAEISEPVPAYSPGHEIDDSVGNGLPSTVCYLSIHLVGVLGKEVSRRNDWWNHLSTLAEAIGVRGRN